MMTSGFWELVLPAMRRAGEQRDPDLARDVARVMASRAALERALIEYRMDRRRLRKALEQKGVTP